MSSDGIGVPDKPYDGPPAGDGGGIAEARVSPGATGVPDKPYTGVQAGGDDTSEGITQKLAATTLAGDETPNQPRSEDPSPAEQSTPTVAAPKNTTNFLGRAIDQVKLAIEADNAERYEEAYRLYYQSLELFMLALKWEGNTRSKEIIRDKVAEYMDRAEKLKQFLTGWKPSSAQAAAPSGSTARSLDGSVFIDRDAPRTLWKDVAGPEDAKTTLLEAAVMPIRFPQLFTGSRRRTACLLLYGVSGVGKRTLAKALAWEAGIGTHGTFLSVSAADLGQGGRFVLPLCVARRRVEASNNVGNAQDSQAPLRHGQRSWSIRYLNRPARGTLTRH